MNALISDKNVPKQLVDQKDGKIVDHIFRYDSPLDGSPIYYIGDSKYYKTEQDVHDTSLYKQYTYAKNVIQFHFDKRTKADDKRVQYRDEVCEGYAFTPNFFISAYIPDDLSYGKNNIGERDWKREDATMTHFDNRLFDRDTLWLRHFDVNLLFIMSLYAQDDASEQEMFKRAFKDKVKEGFKALLKAEYKFFTVTVPEPVEEFIKANFYYLNGMIRFHHEYKGKLLMAIEADMVDENLPDENFTLRQFLESKHAKVEDYEI